MINLKSILVPVDFSLGSKTALEYAAAFAVDFGAQIHVLCVVEEESISANIGGDPLNTKGSWHKENLKNLDSFIPEKYKELDMVKRVVGGLTHEAIIKYSKDNDINLIIMGSNGQTGFIESWLGGTSYEVTRKAPCAVLTVKPEGFGFINN